MPGAVLLAAACLAGGGTTPVALDHAAASQSRLVGVTVSRSACGDRIVFRFGSKPTPAYRIEYEPSARAKTEDASGRQLKIAGRAFLVVRFSQTVTTAQPRRVAGGRHVRDAARTGAFEAVVTWAIGLDAKRPFRVRVSGSTIVISVG
jgi:hypothetical protein